jgi:hypothetical protein
MKKFLYIVFGLLTIIGLIACGGASDGNTEGNTWDKMKWDEGKWN